MPTRRSHGRRRWGEESEPARRYLQLAKAQGARIADEEDRTIHLSDLKRGPWFGIDQQAARLR